MTGRRVTVLFVAVTLALLAVVGAEAADPIKASLISGGNNLAGLQNSDGGWFFVVGDTDCGAGPGVSCPNTFGVTALGLVDAYRITKKSLLKTKALETGDALKAKFAAGPACDGNPSTDADRPFTVDVTFLVELSKIAADASYKQTGVAWFGCVVSDFPVAADRANNRIDRRISQGLDNLGAWDAALDVRAALEVGARKPYALAELKQVFARQSDWDKNTISGCVGCEVLSKANLLKSMATVKSATTQIRAKIAEYQSAVLAAQQSDGSWFGDTQITAYTILGLEPYKFSGTLAQKQAINDAIDAGVVFLLGQQSGSGGYDSGFSEENTEVDGEVLQALSAAH